MELNKLGANTGARPDQAAKARAISLSMAAFDGAQKKSAGTQGSQNRRRYTDALKHLWSLTMSKKYLASSVAAALMVVPAIGLVVQYTTNSTMYHMASAQAPAEIVGQVAPTGDAQLKEYLYRNDVGVPEANRIITDITIAETDDQYRQKVAAMELAAIEAIRLSSGQMSGNAREQTAAGLAHYDQQPSVSVARFTATSVNGFHDVNSDPVSTFSADVDTTSYAVARKAILGGAMPDPDSVRVEELVNYFPYDWKGPDSAETPFKPNVTVMRTPWNKDTKLLHVGIKGYDVAVSAQAPSNLVFLIDVSGSMATPEKLPLLKTAFRMLLNKLKPEDTVSIVTYAGSSGVALEPTKVADKGRILSVIDNLEAGGGTAGADGLAEAYRLAERSYVKDGANRIMLATDGDFNVGPSSDEEMKKLVEAKRKSGIFLSVFGFGSGGYNDGMMQTLAQNGNGVAAYIDTLQEAQKALVQEASASLFTIAKDVKLQVEFNPDKVSEYRLVGYETRALAQKDFNNDKVDAGEIGSGHTVTAIYEIVPKGSPAHAVDDLRYAKPGTADAKTAGSDELAFVKIRYKEPKQDQSKLITLPVTTANEVAADAVFQDVKFSVAVAAYGQKLKNETFVEDYSWDSVRALAEEGRGADPFGYRSEFIKLVDIAASLPAAEAPAGQQPIPQPLKQLQ
ncbi:VWA domain-containing protein [Rhizobium laguerreae]|nr:VWA domain-containing protein [Rhizobium laguerreae]